MSVAINTVMKTSPTYTFKCTMCGNCCHYGKDEYIKITKREYSVISNYLKVSPARMLKQYVKIVKRNFLLRRKNYKCILLLHNKCLIQSIKPVQCKTWPYWKENYHKRQFKRHVMVKCKGIVAQEPQAQCAILQK
jgi:Fe-S-cluster containining protein